MIIMLPQDNRKVDEVIAYMNTEMWNSAISQMGSYNVNLSLPRFKAECSYQMEKAILPAMGMQVPFSDHADFSGITDSPFKISGVIHKTLVDVYEEGTEAVAATVGKGMWGSVDDSFIQTIDYVVNKPFAFAICENSTGIILFMGKMNDI